MYRLSNSPYVLVLHVSTGIFDYGYLDYDMAGNGVSLKYSESWWGIFICLSLSRFGHIVSCFSIPLARRLCRNPIVFKDIVVKVSLYYQPSIVEIILGYAGVSGFSWVYICAAELGWFWVVGKGRILLAQVLLYTICMFHVYMVSLSRWCQRLTVVWMSCYGDSWFLCTFLVPVLFCLAIPAVIAISCALVVFSGVLWLGGCLPWIWVNFGVIFGYYSLGFFLFLSLQVCVDMFRGLVNPLVVISFYLTG